MDGDASVWTGTPEQIAETMLAYRKVGFDTFIVELPAPYDAETMDSLMTVVKPMVGREAPLSPSWVAGPDDRMRRQGGAMATRIVDLSHPIEAGMVTYPGLPVPEIHAVLDRATSAGRYAPGVTFQIDLITLCGNTGTYMDSPFHRWEDGADLAALPLERLVDLPTVRIDMTASATPAVDADALRDRSTSPGARSSSTPASTASGGPRTTCATTRSSRSTRWSCWSPPAPRSWGSTRSTSTRPPIPSVPPIRCCCGPASRSSST